IGRARWILVVFLAACASAGHQTGSNTGGSGGEGGASPDGEGDKGGGATGGRGGAPAATPDAGNASEPDAATAGEPDGSSPDGSASKPSPDGASGGSGGSGGTSGGEKHVVVLIGATSDPKDATNSMMAILAAMKDSDGIIAEKVVDGQTTAATVANKAL